MSEGVKRFDCYGRQLNKQEPYLVAHFVLSKDYDALLAQVEAMERHGRTGRSELILQNRDLADKLATVTAGLAVVGPSTELLKLYDWRKEVGASITPDDARKYGHKKKRLWEELREAIAALGNHPGQAMLDELERLRRDKEASERLAQELGWPGYSQGGNPVSYIYAHATEAESSRDRLAGEVARLKEKYERL